MAISPSATSSTGDRTSSSSAATALSKISFAVGYGTGVSDGRRVVRDVDGLPVRVDIERIRAWFTPAGTGVFHASERDVGLEPVRGPVHLHAARLHAPRELLAAVDAVRPDRRRQAVRARVRERERLLEPGDAVQRR